MKNRLSIAACLTATILLGACEATKEQFDFAKKAPDEFAVVKRAPLEIPADMKSLPAPRPGAPRPQEASATEMARTAVVGVEAQRSIASQNNVSEGEAVLLQRTGAANASPAIRDAVDKETAEIAEEKMPGIDHLRRMVGQKVESPATVVDPVKETERLRQNKAAGKPVTQGQTPIIEEE